MRIIAGSARSIPLKAPPGLTRPTTDRVRESLFSVLGELVIKARVLDLFAGSGSLGLEALSRGAAEATFVESHTSACTIISENLAKTGLNGGRVHRRGVFPFLADVATGSYDLIFADPPYARDEKNLAVMTSLLTTSSLADSLARDGHLIIESLASVPLPKTPLWHLAREKTYGDTRISFLTPLR